jgi:hypothetical protein
MMEYYITHSSFAAHRELTYANGTVNLSFIALRQCKLMYLTLVTSTVIYETSRYPSHGLHFVGLTSAYTMLNTPWVRDGQITKAEL